MNLSEFLEGKGTYVGIRLSEQSKADIEQLQRTLRLKNPLDPSKFHSTVLFSRKEIPVVPSTESHAATSTKVECWDTKDGKKAVVLKLDCDSLVQRHLDLRSIGGTHDYPTYQPHITLSYNDDVTEMPVSVDLMLVDEYVEDLDLTWTDNE